MKKITKENSNTLTPYGKWVFITVHFTALFLCSLINANWVFRLWIVWIYGSIWVLYEDTKKIDRK